MNLLINQASLSSDLPAENRTKMPQTHAGPPGANHPAPRKRLLLVDDNAEGRRALSRILEFYNFEVTSAGDGTSALELLDSKPSFEVILTDLLLPDLDGREVALKAHSLEPSPLVVLITGWDFSPDDVDHHRWGIDRVFLKPLNVSELVATLDELEAHR